MRVLGHPERREQAAVERRRRPARSRWRRRPASSSAATRQRDHLGVALGARDADQLDAALEELARLPAPRSHRAVGVCRSSRGAAAARRPRSGWPPAGRSGSSCPSAARAPRRCSSNRPEAAPRRRARRRAAAPPRTRARACTPRRSRRSSKRAAQPVAERAQLAHLVGQHVARARWDRVDHRRPPRRRLGGHALGGRRARCARRAPAGARRSARSRGRSGGCCRSPTCPRRTAPR